jgi:hypothetical protein
MIETLPESQGNVLVLKAEDKLTDRDYKDVLIPSLEEIIRKYGKARLLLDISEDFEGWEPAAMWDDARFGLAHRNDFEKMGVIGGPRWIEWGLKLSSLVVGGEIKCFSPGERGQALNWIKA